MAQLSPQTVARKLVYQSDAVNNLQEGPGGQHVTPSNGGSIDPSSGGPGGTVQVQALTIPAPGKGFRTGKDASHSSGTYPRLVTAILQQSTDTVAGQGSDNPAGFHVSEVSLGLKEGSNSLQNDTSAMAVSPFNGNGSNPTPASGVDQVNGLSQDPSHE
jgi:hypothetical protein